MLKFPTNSFRILSKICVNQLHVNRLGFHRHLVYSSLTSRSLIRVTGPDSFPLLQGLISNDIQKLNSQPSIFTVFLNQAGRILFDSIIYSTSTENEVLIECDAHVQQTLIRHLKLYRVKKNVQVDDVADEIKPIVLWDPGHSDIPASLRKSSAASEEHPLSSAKTLTLDLGPNLVAVQDPRIDALGWRLILPAQQNLEQESKLKVECSTERDYRLLLYSLGIGEGFIDYPISSSFPLESNVDFLNGVNFHKGCYIGQELTARTHHTGVVRKRLMPFRLPENAKIGSEVDKATLQLLNQAGKPVAKVRNIIDSYGLALARVQEVLASNEIKLGDHLVHLEKPTWWPPEPTK